MLVQNTLLVVPESIGADIPDMWDEGTEMVEEGTSDLLTSWFSNIDETVPTFCGRPVTVLRPVSSFVLCCRMLIVLQSTGSLVLTFWHSGVLSLVGSSKQFCSRVQQVALCDKFCYCCLCFTRRQSEMRTQIVFYTHLYFICLWTNSRF